MMAILTPSFSESSLQSLRIAIALMKKKEKTMMTMKKNLPTLFWGFLLVIIG